MAENRPALSERRLIRETSITEKTYEDEQGVDIVGVSLGLTFVVSEEMIFDAGPSREAGLVLPK